MNYFIPIKVMMLAFLLTILGTTLIAQNCDSLPPFCTDLNAKIESGEQSTTIALDELDILTNMPNTCLAELDIHIRDMEGTQVEIVDNKLTLSEGEYEATIRNTLGTCWSIIDVSPSVSSCENDSIAPVVILNGSVVSIDLNGQPSLIYDASFFDLGSYDDCGAVTVEGLVTADTSLLGIDEIPENLGFSEEITFTKNGLYFVVLKVTDPSGNAALAFSQVLVTNAQSRDCREGSELEVVTRHKNQIRFYGRYPIYITATETVWTVTSDCDIQAIEVGLQDADGNVSYEEEVAITGDGTYTLYVRVRDIVGNEVLDTVVWEVIGLNAAECENDTVAPLISLDYAKQEFRLAEGMDAIELTLDSFDIGVFDECWWVLESGLSLVEEDAVMSKSIRVGAGEHTIYIAVQDGSGNTAIAQHEINVLSNSSIDCDTRAPHCQSLRVKLDEGESTKTIALDELDLLEGMPNTCLAELDVSVRDFEGLEVEIVDNKLTLSEGFYELTISNSLGTCWSFIDVLAYFSCEDDTTAPSVISNAEVLSFDLNGNASLTLEASYFDIGSFDDCGVAKIEAANGFGVDPSLFDDEASDFAGVTFAEEVILTNEGIYPVILKVSDSSGNFSYGYSTVWVTNGLSTCFDVDTIAPNLVLNTQELDTIYAGSSDPFGIVFSAGDFIFSAIDDCGPIDKAQIAIKNLTIGEERTTFADEQTILTSGVYNVYLSVRDNLGNEARDSLTLRYEHIPHPCIFDTIAPVAMAVDSVTLNLGGKPAYLDSEQFDEGSTDNCGIATITVAVSGELVDNPENLMYSEQPLFDQIGIQYVYLKVTDYAGNEDIALTVVTVEVNGCSLDTSAPVLVVEDKLELSLQGQSERTVEADFFDAGTHDNCGIVRLEAVIQYPADEGVLSDLVFAETVTFTQSGEYTVFVRAYDFADNRTEGFVEVTVVDESPCLDDSLAPQLDESVLSHYPSFGFGLPAGETSLVLNSEEFAGSVQDNCQNAVILELSLGGETYGESLMLVEGRHDIWLRAEDTQGNRAAYQLGVAIGGGNPHTCEGLDLASPTVITDDGIEIDLEGQNDAVIEADFFDAGSIDNCGIESLEVGLTRGSDPLLASGDIVFGSTVTFTEPGDYIVHLRATDAMGNYTIGWTEVRVVDELLCNQDTIAPIAMAYDSVRLGLHGKPVYLDTEQFDEGSTDNCSIAAITVAVSREPVDDPENLVYSEQALFIYLGIHYVYLKVTDAAGNEDIALTIVEVENSPSPRWRADFEEIRLDANTYLADYATKVKEATSPDAIDTEALDALFGELTIALSDSTNYLEKIYAENGDYLHTLQYMTNECESRTSSRQTIELNDNNDLVTGEEEVEIVYSVGVEKEAALGVLVHTGCDSLEVVKFTSISVSDCGAGTIERWWLVVDHCLDREYEFSQTIVIEPTCGPLSTQHLVLPNDTTICESTYDLIDPNETTGPLGKPSLINNQTDLCFDPEYRATDWVIGLPEQNIKFVEREWEAFDAAGNRLTWTHHIVVNTAEDCELSVLCKGDTIAPMAVMEDSLRVVLGGTRVYIAAETLGKGSTDDCGIATIEVAVTREPVDNLESLKYNERTSFIHLGIHYVYLKVTDFAGNEDIASAIVEVENGPSLTWRADFEEVRMDVSTYLTDYATKVEEAISGDAIDTEALDALFGELTIELSDSTNYLEKIYDENGDYLHTLQYMSNVCEERIDTRQTIELDENNDLVIGEEEVDLFLNVAIEKEAALGVLVHTSCDDFEVSQSLWTELNDCGVGFIRRQWHVIDHCLDREYEFTQTIEIERPVCSLEGRMRLPNDTVICAEPVYHSDGSLTIDAGLYLPIGNNRDLDGRQLGIGYRDEVFAHEEQGQTWYVVSREWTAHDWCIGEEVRDTQTIILSCAPQDRCPLDEEAPHVFERIDIESIEYDEQSPRVCLEDVLTYYAFVDNCAMEEELTITLWMNGEQGTCFDNPNNTLTLGVMDLNGNTAWRRVPIGHPHCEEGRDTLPPVILAYNYGIALDQANGQYMIDFDLAGFDDCTLGEDLVYYVSKTLIDDPSGLEEESILFVAEEELNSTDLEEGELKAYLYVIDETGNYSYKQISINGQEFDQASPSDNALEGSADMILSFDKTAPHELLVTIRYNESQTNAAPANWYKVTNYQYDATSSGLNYDMETVAEDQMSILLHIGDTGHYNVEALMAGQMMNRLFYVGPEMFEDYNGYGFARGGLVLNAQEDLSGSSTGFAVRTLAKEVTFYGSGFEQSGGEVIIQVFDLQGRLMDQFEEGIYSKELNQWTRHTAYPAGIYVARLFDTNTQQMRSTKFSVRK